MNLKFISFLSGKFSTKGLFIKVCSLCTAVQRKTFVKFDAKKYSSQFNCIQSLVDKYSPNSISEYFLKV